MYDWKREGISVALDCPPDGFAEFLVRWSFVLGKQVLLCIENPELIDLKENLALQKAYCHPVTFRTKMVTAAGTPLTMFSSIYTSAFSDLILQTSYSPMNTYNSASAWPAHLLCSSLNNWWQNKGVTSHTKWPSMWLFVHSSKSLWYSPGKGRTVHGVDPSTRHTGLEHPPVGYISHMGISSLC